MNYIIKHALAAAAIVGIFSIAGTGLVSLTFSATEDKIAENERLALLRSLSAIISADLYDNDIVSDILLVTDNSLAVDSPVVVYRARKEGKPVAAVITAIAPDGYNGKIKILVAIKTDNTLAGVRVVKHAETPGLGDGVEENRSDWILGFGGKSLRNPVDKNWGVKRDGGVFDQFTGATITPRAVVKAVKNTLLYYQQHQSEIYAAPEQSSAKNTGVEKS